MKIINSIKKWWNRYERRNRYEYIKHLRTLQDEHFKFTIYYKDLITHKFKTNTHFKTFTRRNQGWSHAGNQIAFREIATIKQGWSQFYDSKTHIGWLIKPEDIIDVRFEKVDKNYKKLKG
jgi:hypothetical protein